MQPGWLSCAIWAEGVEWLSCLGIIWALRILTRATGGYLVARAGLSRRLHRQSECQPGSGELNPEQPIPNCDGSSPSVTSGYLAYDAQFPKLRTRGASGRKGACSAHLST